MARRKKPRKLHNGSPPKPQKVQIQNPKTVIQELDHQPPPQQTHSQTQTHDGLNLQPNNGVEAEEHLQPESPKTVELERKGTSMSIFLSPTPPGHVSTDPLQVHNHGVEAVDHRQPESPKIVELEPKGTSMSTALSPTPPAHVSTDPLHPHLNTHRKSTGGRKKPLGYWKQKKLQTLQTHLQKHFRPIPFVPKKTLDFAKHETLLRTLGLWDFVHLEFDHDIRTDLIEQLIATYDPKAHPYSRSCVNGVPIRLSRTDMARPLKIQAQRWCGDSNLIVDCDEALFIEELVSNWMVLHDEGWVMPDKVESKFMKFIKERQPGKVDWAGLVWFMVESEILQARELVHCHYVSHLQLLLKFQKPGFFDEEFKKEGFVDVEDNVGDVKMGGLDDFDGQELENGQIGLGLEQGKSENMLKVECLVNYQSWNLSIEQCNKEGYVDAEDNVGDVKKGGLDDSENQQIGLGLGLGQDKSENELKADSSEKEGQGVIAVKVSVADEFFGIELENRQIDLSLGQGENENEHKVEVSEENEEGVIYVEMVGSNDFYPMELENRQINLSLGLGENEDEPRVEVLEEEEEGVIDVKMGGSNDFYAMQLENRQIDSSLWQSENEKEPKVEASVKEVEDAVDVKMGGSDDLCRLELENRETDLNAEQDKIESESVEAVRGEDVVDLEECREKEKGQWLLNGKNDAGGHFLRQCSLSKVGEFELHSERKEVAEEETHDLPIKCTPIKNFTSADLVQSMGTKNIYCGPPTHIVDDSSEESVSGMDILMKMDGSSVFGNALKRKNDYENDFFVEPFVSEFHTHINLGGPSVFDNSFKTEIDRLNDVHHHSLNDCQKRMRSDGSWDGKSLDFNFCMDQMHIWMTKAKTMYATREQACMSAQLNQQMMVNKLKQQDNIIQHYEKTKHEEQQKREGKIYRLEREICLMENLLDDYKKALRETRREFAKYRERFQLPEVPFYRDVAGSGGVVLSATDLEKQQLEREREDKVKHFMIEAMIKEFQLEWLDKLEVHLIKVDLLDDRLLVVEKEVKLLKEIFPKRRILGA